jgi:hypothetical protein
MQEGHSLVESCSQTGESAQIGGKVVGALRDMDNVGEAILVLWERGTS